MPTTAYRATLDVYDGSLARLWCCGRNGWRDGIVAEAGSTGPASTRSSSAIRFHRRGSSTAFTPTRAKLSREEPYAGCDREAGVSLPVQVWSVQSRAGRTGASLAGVAATRGPKRRQRLDGVWN